MDSRTTDTESSKDIMDEPQYTKNEVEIMERALNTENEFLKFVNNLPISAEENRFRKSEVRHFYINVIPNYKF